MTDPVHGLLEELSQTTNLMRGSGPRRAITYLDDGVEIRVQLPLKPGALKFAQGFLETLLRDSGNT